MKKLVLICGVLLIQACSHQLSLYPRGGGQVATGVANEAGKTIEIQFEGHLYKGRYSYDGGGVVSVQSFGTSQAFSGARSVTAQGSSYGTAYVPGTGNGRIFAIAPSGNSIRCEFQYKGGSGLGVCEDNQGRVFDLVIEN